MSSIEEKIREMEPAQIAIFAGIGLVVVLLIYALVASGGDEEEQTTELGVPENRDQVKDYESKLDAYNRSNDERSNDVSLEFDINDFKTGDKLTADQEKEKLDKEVDSVLNQSKITYTKQPKKTSSKSSRKKGSNYSNSSKTQKPKEDINKSFNDFYNSNPITDQSEEDFNKQTDPLIYAVIHGNQTKKEGQRVKLRLTKKAIIRDIAYDRNSYVYATISFQSYRVLLDIESINMVPVDISAYDTEDGSLGINVEGAELVGEIGKEGSKDVIDDVDIEGLPIGTTIKKVFQKKQQVPTVTLLNNTKLILKPNKS